MTEASQHDKGPQVHRAVEGSEVIGYVVIDSTIGGRSAGGLRMMPDVDEAELRELAHTMTLKYGFLGMPIGGAKAGVRCSPEAPLEERRQRLAAFARAVAPLLQTGAYTPGTDMGTDTADIVYVMQSVGVPVSQAELEGIHSAYYTAMTVLSGVRQALRHVGMPMAHCRVAIEGWGKVGSVVGELLAEAGACIVALSTVHGALFDPQGFDVTALQALAHEYGSHFPERYQGAQQLPREALLSAEVDVLCPCARHHSVHAANADSVSARIVCPGANNALTAKAEQMLFRRGVLCLPDFVTNSGGVLGGTLEGALATRAQIAAFIEKHIDRRVAWLIEEATRRQVSPRDIAVPLALKRFEAMRHRASLVTTMSHLTQLQRFGMRLLDRGWVPRGLAARVIGAFLARSLAW